MRTWETGALSMLTEALKKAHYQHEFSGGYIGLGLDALPDDHPAVTGEDTTAGLVAELGDV
ncbi:hypothetical protein [Pyruvatibacter mobilis]|uniref:hypothetical protein n=1 Tax=Pyruvatibacter mobilis TaxID=1712261 RepID=UPI003C7AF484